MFRAWEKYSGGINNLSRSEYEIPDKCKEKLITRSIKLLQKTVRIVFVHSLSLTLSICVSQSLIGFDVSLRHNDETRILWTCANRESCCHFVAAVVWRPSCGVHTKYLPKWISHQVSDHITVLWKLLVFKIRNRPDSLNLMVFFRYSYDLFKVQHSNIKTSYLLKSMWLLFESNANHLYMIHTFYLRSSSLGHNVNCSISVLSIVEDIIQQQQIALNGGFKWNYLQILMFMRFISITNESQTNLSKGNS